MQSLGGMVYAVAKSRVRHGYVDHGGSGAAPAASSPSASGFTNMFFSRLPSVGGVHSSAAHAQSPSDPVFTINHHGASSLPGPSSLGVITVINFGSLSRLSSQLLRDDC